MNADQNGFQIGLNPRKSAAKVFRVNIAKVMLANTAHGKRSCFRQPFDDHESDIVRRLCAL